MSMLRSCPKCGGVLVNPAAKQCRSCYMKSDEFHERLARQAKNANIKANQVRWAYKANDWIFADSSPELAYVIGAYLTDGWIQHFSKSAKVAGFAISGAYPEFMAHVLACLQVTGLPARYIKPKEHGSKLRQIQIRVLCSSQNFGRWLETQCEGKQRIPQFLYGMPMDHKIAFIAGTVDGDGCVDRNGAITVYGTKAWMKDLPDLLATIPIRTNGYRVIKILPSGKPFARVSIHRGDFVECGGFLSVPMKQQRMIHPVQPPPTLYVCPNCGKQRMTHKNLKQCRECWRNDETFKDHLRRISPLGNAAKKHR